MSSQTARALELLAALCVGFVAGWIAPGDRGERSLAPPAPVHDQPRRAEPRLRAGVKSETQPPAVGEPETGRGHGLAAPRKTVTPGMSSVAWAAHLEGFQIFGRAQLSGSKGAEASPSAAQLGSLAGLLAEIAEPAERLSGGDVQAFFRLPAVQAEWLLAASAQFDEDGNERRQSALRGLLDDLGPDSLAESRSVTGIHSVRLRLFEVARGGIPESDMADWSLAAASALLATGEVVRVPLAGAETRAGAVVLFRDMWQRVMGVEIPSESARDALEVFGNWWDDGSVCVHNLRDVLGESVGRVLESKAAILKEPDGVAVALRLNLEMARIQEVRTAQLVVRLPAETQASLAGMRQRPLFVVGHLR